MSGDQYRAGSKVEGLFVQGLNGSGWLVCESGGIASWWQGRDPMSRLSGQSSRGAKLGAPGMGGRTMHPGRPKCQGGREDRALRWWWALQGGIARLISNGAILKRAIGQSWQVLPWRDSWVTLLFLHHTDYCKASNKNVGIGFDCFYYIVDCIYLCVKMCVSMC